MSKTFEGLITLTQVADGGEYRVETNQEEILKFYVDNNLQLSPSILKIIPKKNNELILNNSNFSFDININYNENEFKLLEQIEVYILAEEYEAGKIYFQYNKYNEEYEQINIDENTWNTEEKYYTKEIKELYTKTDNDYSISLEEILKIILYIGANQESKTLIENLRNAFEGDYFILRFSIVENNNNNKIDKIIPCRNLLSKDMAKLQINATNIVGYIDDTSLTFDEEGIKLKNGLLQILNDNNEVLFGVKENSEENEASLFLKGTIYAIDGEFSGELKTPTGNIGGFIIEDNILKSESIQYINISTELTEEKFIYGEFYIKNADEYQLIDTIVETNKWQSEKNYYKFNENTKKYELANDEVDTENKFQQAILSGKKYYIANYNPETPYYYKKNNIELNGEEGTIYANNITLGESAKIEKYIDLGNGAKIYNSSYSDNNNKILSSQDISIYNDGVMKVGNITIDGKESNGQIYVKDESNNIKWKIDGEGTANFNDIYANNVHLSNTIMEINTVQNVGSLMIFKDAWTPSSIDDIETIIDEKRVTVSQLKFDDITSLNADDWIYDGNQYYKIYEVSEDSKIVTLNKQIDIQNNNKFNPITKIGKVSSDFVFSIFGSNSNNKISTDMKYDFANQYSITLADFVENNNGSLSFKNRLVLGYLDKIDESNKNIKGIGLYADNVYLKGSLISEQSGDEKPYYSGINTASGVKMPNNGHFPGKETGEILIWAGAPSLDKIKESPFRVDNYGNFYANSGYFEGSIISKATISAATMEAATIRTAILEGWGDNKTSLLKILNANEGIGFYTRKKEYEEVTEVVSEDNYSNYYIKDSNNEYIKPNSFEENITYYQENKSGKTSEDKKIFTIGNTGFKAGEEGEEVEFIKIGENGISTSISSSFDKSRLEFKCGFELQEDELSPILKLQMVNNSDNSNSNYQYSFSIDQNDIKIMHGNIQLIEVDNTNNISTYETIVKFNNKIQYSDIMSYQISSTNDGYDLYIS